MFNDQAVIVNRILAIMSRAHRVFILFYPATNKRTSTFCNIVWSIVLISSQAKGGAPISATNRSGHDSFDLTQIYPCRVALYLRRHDVQLS